MTLPTDVDVVTVGVERPPTVGYAKAMEPQIIALGGGGFSMEPDNPRLDSYVLEQSGAQRPRVCFVSTASADSDNYLRRFYESFSRFECTPTHLSVFELPAEGIAARLDAADIVYVGGGSTFNLIALWRAWGIDHQLRAMWQRGVLLAGISAGALCWFEQGHTDSLSRGELKPIECLGFLLGSFSPHFTNEARQTSYRALVASGALSGGYGVDDSVALHFVGTRLHRAVSSRPTARAWRIERRAADVVETELEITRLA
jgi:dipeptidase E